MSLTQSLADARAAVARLQDQAGALGITLPKPPEQQDESVCCGRGCHPCMFTYYFDALAAWRERVEQALEAAALISARAPADAVQEKP